MANDLDSFVRNPGLDHISLQIFQDLDVESLLNCAQVSPDWLQFIKENEIIWQQKFSKEFPLHKACESGDQNKVKLLIAIGVDVNLQVGRGRTPLHLACLSGHLDIVESLLKNPSININIQDINGRTSLHWACNRGHLNIVESLLKNSAIDVNIQTNNGKTPLDIARQFGKEDIVDIITKAELENMSAK